ncbi:hypothetical protein [Agrobacterium sp. MS2]|uniref:hypothetical protein n=1 Tax=Agrobacterium sp. MS2 TaxID=1345498 RepID=UPI000DBF4BD1|nr:hypothetical protein [Agrobacterium sp. MS2]RAL96043.1 hypothetical protein DOU54_20010 [Agrobacterium sp. MS2]
MRTGLIIAATITALTASTAIAQTFETVDRSPAGDRFEKSVNFDILGIQPGDTIEDVKAKMKAEFPEVEPEETRLKGSVSTPEGARVQMEFVNEIAFVDSGSKNQIYVNFASEVYDNRALAIRRTVHFKEFTTADIFRKQVAEKYGQPSIVEDQNGFLNLYYIYANGRLLSESDAPKSKENCKRINEGSLCDYVEETQSPESGKKLEIAQKPCAAFFHGNWHTIGKYRFDQRYTVIKDDQCDGIIPPGP